MNGSEKIMIIGPSVEKKKNVLIYKKNVLKKNSNWRAKLKNILIVK